MNEPIPETTVPTETRSILIIEDDQALLRGLSDNFRSRGFDVMTATDGLMGVERALAADPDVIVLDIMLPELNGYEICRRLRGAKVDTPIVMLTAKGEEDDIVRGLHLGADDYVTKPFSIRELVARVEALIRRVTPPDEVICFGECELDLDAHSLLRNGEPVELTSKEFGLLCLFLRRAGRALTRDEILRQVWGTSVIVTSRSVDRCVTTLRGKIESDSRHPRHIATIRDVGYRFDF